MFTVWIEGRNITMLDRFKKGQPPAKAIKKLFPQYRLSMGWLKVRQTKLLQITTERN